MSRLSWIFLSALSFAAVTPPSTLWAQGPSLHDFELRGSGPKALVLIPCFSCRWKSYEPFMERNLASYTMLAVTPLGFGGSEVPSLPIAGPTPAWQDATVHAIARKIVELNLRDVTVIGHSLGGAFAPRVAAALPDRVTGVILLDANPWSDRSWFKEDPAARLVQADTTTATQRRNLADATAWQQFNSPPSYAEPDRRVAIHGWFMATPKEVMIQYWRENSLVDVNPVLAGLTMPVLDVKSLSPAIANTDSAKVDRLATWRTNGTPARLQVIYLPRSRHFIMEERPEWLDRIVSHATGGTRFCPAPAGAPWECPS